MRLLRWRLSIKKAERPASLADVLAEVADLRGKLDLVARQTEATRKKVYRDGLDEVATTELGKEPALDSQPAVIARGFHTGDPANF